MESQALRERLGHPSRTLLDTDWGNRDEPSRLDVSSEHTLAAWIVDTIDATTQDSSAVVTGGDGGEAGGSAGPAANGRSLRGPAFAAPSLEQLERDRKSVV